MGFDVSERSQRRFALRMPRMTRSRLLRVIAFLLGGAITVNATLFQSERHPAPMFRTLAVDAPSPPKRGDAERSAEAFRPERTASLPAASDPLLRDLQSELAARGYYKGDPNGRASPATTKAIRDFQSDQRMNVDGLPSAPLLAEVRSMRETVREELFDLVKRANAPERGDKLGSRRFEPVKPAGGGDAQPARFAPVEPRAGLKDKPRSGPVRLAPGKASARKEAARGENAPRDGAKRAAKAKHAPPSGAAGASPPNKAATNQAGSKAKPVREARAEPRGRAEPKSRAEPRSRAAPGNWSAPGHKAVAKLAQAAKDPAPPLRQMSNALIRPPANAAAVAPQ